jgi:hypothetical protein
MKAIIQTPTSNLENSLSFYTKLNFKNLGNNLVTDGKVIIQINDHQFARAGIKFYNKDWTSILSALKELVSIIETEESYLFAMPSGTWISLMKTDFKLEFTIEEKSFSVLGNYAGVSLETTDINKAIKIVEILDFSKTMGDIEQGWLAFTNKTGFGISMMTPNSCPHLFFNPSLTYFNGKENLNIISKIRNLKIPITQEISHFNKEGIVDNIIIRDHGGLGFFLFSD